MKGTVTIEVDDFLRLKALENKEFDFDKLKRQVENEIDIERLEIAQDIQTLLTKIATPHQIYAALTDIEFKQLMFGRIKYLGKTFEALAPKKLTKYIIVDK